MTVIVLLALMLGQSLFYYPQLPNTIASHFNAVGQADNWQAKQTFFIFYWLLVLFTTALFVFLEPLLRRLSPKQVNLPHKEYWLAPERRTKSLQFLGQHFQWMAAGTLALLVAVLQTVIVANLQGSATLALGPTMLILIAYLLFTAAWMVFLMKRFSKPA